MARRFWLVVTPLVGVAACADADLASPPCTDMCAKATELYDGCLADWGLDWTAAGHEDAASHERSCQTWAWEHTQLLDADLVDTTCAERAAIFQEGSCADYTSIDWNADL